MALIAACEDLNFKENIELNRCAEKTEFLKQIKSEHTRRESKLHSENNRIKGILADRVRVDKKYRKCFEACLSPVLQSLLTESQDDALRCIEDLQVSGNGKVQILYPNGNGDRAKDSSDGRTIGNALDLLGGNGVSDYLGSYLSGVVVTESVEGAMSVLQKAPEKRVVTLDGVFFDGPGRIVVAGSDDIEMTLLEFDSKIEELAGSIGRCERRMSRLKERRNALDDVKRRTGEQADALRGELRTLEEENDKALEIRKERELNLAVAREKITGLSAAQAEGRAAVEEIRSKLATESTPPSTVDESETEDRTMSDLEIRAVELEREKEALAEMAGKIRLEIATVTGEISTACEKRKNVEMLDTELRELIVYRNEDGKRCRSEIETANTEIVDSRSTIERLHADMDDVEKRIEEAKEIHERVQESCNRLDTELKELKNQRDEKKENIQRCSLEIVTRETRINDLLEKARESLNQDLEAFVRDRGKFEASEWEELDFDALEGLRKTVETFGPVNMLALDEFNEKKERFDFLSKQKTDLEEARDSLTQAIRRINKEARRRLNETFALVRQNFRDTFVTLFDGGEADLLFVDSDDPLEANIRIVANPKGKKLHDIASLSGGERALVALSLLFAIYLVKPSPFCVFDEVDAPLDDANIGRFVKLLKSFTDRTQFVVITHNKKTMEAADTLYGVTMQEPGVSRMISVHIGEVDEFSDNNGSHGSSGESIVREPTVEEVPVHT
jgi:chromosome segregation protein